LHDFDIEPICAQAPLELRGKRILGGDAGAGRQAVAKGQNSHRLRLSRR